MAIVLYQKMPTGATLEMIQAVTEEMDVKSLPPDGLIVHTVVDIGGRITILDVWETSEDLEKFRTSRLDPAFAAVAQRMGVDLAALGAPDTEILETLDIIYGG
ncbi:MAG TPA: hypothetical protein VHL53_00940 [Acidimicrobiia bacterium]|nr:hypothetical protein [Acidimicrobiia bacterium]